MATRRLSLTILLVAPLITAQDYEDAQTPEPGSAVSGEHLPVGNNNRNKIQEPLDTWSPGDITIPWTTERAEETSTWATVQGRVKREDGEDMETAEQILFRPIFRHRQMIADRLERQRQRNAERRDAEGSNFGPPGQLQAAQNRVAPSALDDDNDNQNQQLQYPNAKYASLVATNPVNADRPLRPVLVR